MLATSFLGVLVGRYLVADPHTRYDAALETLAWAEQREPAVRIRSRRDPIVVWAANTVVASALGLVLVIVLLPVPVYTGSIAWAMAIWSALAAVLLGGAASIRIARRRRFDVVVEGLFALTWAGGTSFLLVFMLVSGPWGRAVGWGFLLSNLTVMVSAAWPRSAGRVVDWTLAGAAAALAARDIEASAQRAREVVEELAPAATTPVPRGWLSRILMTLRRAARNATAFTGSGTK